MYKSFNTIRIITAILISLTLFACPGCSARDNAAPDDTAQSSNPQDSTADTDPLTRSDFYFDTVITIALYAPKDEALLDGCMDLCARYEALFSSHVEGSDIDRINKANGTPVTVDPETTALIEEALYYADLSEDRFDPTIGAVSSLWNFSGDPAGPVPDKAEIEEALSHVDRTTVSIDKEAGTITLKDPASRIDPGAIAKGYIADRIKDYLLEEGVTSAYINLGGNVLLLGSKPDGTPFRVGVQDPTPGSDASDIILPLSTSDTSVVTSGVYERYFIEDDTYYHHILDTSTGYPADNGLLSVTILSKTSVEGDGLSTACFALGKEKGPALIESLPDTEALFITEDYDMIYTTGFPRD